LKDIRENPRKKVVGEHTQPPVGESKEKHVRREQKNDWNNASSRDGKNAKGNNG